MPEAFTKVSLAAVRFACGRIGRTVVPLLVGGAVATGCGGSKTLHTGPIQDQIKREFSAQTGVPVTVASCPASVPAKTGATFTCRATFAGGETEPVQATQDDAAGHVHVRLVNLLIVKLQRVIAQRFAANGIAVSVTCPSHHPIRRGDVFSCTARDANGRTAAVRVTQLDDQGHVHFQQVRG